MRSPNGLKKQAEDKARTDDAFRALSLPRDVRWTEDVQNQFVILENLLEFDRRTERFLYTGYLLHSAWSAIADKMTRMHSGSYAKYTFQKTPLLCVGSDDTHDRFVLTADTSRTVESAGEAVFPGLWLGVSAGAGCFPAFATAAENTNKRIVSPGQRSIVSPPRQETRHNNDRYLLAAYDNAPNAAHTFLKTADGAKSVETLHTDLFASMLYAASATARAFADVARITKKARK